jgi:hypothetical protein
MAAFESDSAQLHVADLVHARQQDRYVVVVSVGCRNTLELDPRTYWQWLP